VIDEDRLFELIDQGCRSAIFGTQLRESVVDRVRSEVRGRGNESHDSIATDERPVHWLSPNLRYQRA
jgi:hypothetical protein